MSDLILPRLRHLTSRIGLGRYRAKARLERLSRAWRYFSGGLTADDTQRVMLDCRDPAGWHPLLVLTVEDTLEQARETFADHPELARLIADGCARVGDKWESYGDELYEARRWAIDLAEGYAADKGVALVRLDDDDTAADHESHDGFSVEAQDDAEAILKAKVAARTAMEFGAYPEHIDIEERREGVIAFIDRVTPQGRQAVAKDVEFDDDRIHDSPTG